MRPATRTGAEALPPGGQQLHALGAFIWQDGVRARAAAGRQRGEPPVVECRLRGASMADAIPPRSRIRIVFGHEPYRVGEVVAFMAGPRVVAHRVVRSRRSGAATFLLTRGDARVLCDAPVRTDAVLGRVVAFDPGSGWRPVAGRRPAPRRERIVASALQRAVEFALAIGPGCAAGLAARLEAFALRRGWTRTLLYKARR